MPEQFDDESVAREAIATSPEITQSVVDNLEEEGGDNSEQSKIAVNVSPSSDDLRNSRLTSACIKGIVSAFGHEADGDQLAATQEITAEGFCALSGLNPPKALKIGITMFLLVGSFVPVGVAALKSYREVKGNNV
ncbi:MAG: hypothetical protein JKY93_03180 [Gammaproteobacteria bacterium]|nr:hypothetical protein [Gammaproteobacteria bacterium]